MVRSLYILAFGLVVAGCMPAGAKLDLAGPDVTIDVFSCPNAVEGQPIRCTIKASSRSGTPICRLEFDGQVVQAGVCSAERTVEIVISRPGLIAVQLVATSGSGSANRTVTVEVARSPNRAPVITRFVALNPSGVAPHRPQLEFTAADPEGDPITCVIDVNADGTDDLTVPCASGRADVTLTQPGAIRIRLAVTDERDGLAVSDITVTVLAPGGMGGAAGAGGMAGMGGSAGAGGMAGAGGRGGAGGGMGGRGGAGMGGAGMGGAGMGGRGGAGMGGAGMGGAGMGGAGGMNPNEPVEVRPAAVYWGQTVITPTLRLVAGKAAQVRVWVVSEGTTQPNPMEVTAEIRQGAMTLGTVTLTPPVRLPTTAMPGPASSGWYVGTLPAAQVQPNIEVVVRVDPANTVRERDEGNNQLSVRPVVGRANQLNLTHVPVETGGRIGAPPNGIVGYISERWPVASIDVRTRAPFTFAGTIAANTSAGWSQLLTGLGQAKMNDNSRRNYYGWVKVSYNSGIAGIGNIGQGTSTGRDDSADTAAHELGHNFGRQHAPCQVSGDANYPYAGANIGTWGVDSTGALKDPARLKDLMSYCDPTWISDYTYAGAQSFLERGTQFTPGVMLAHVQSSTTDEGLLLGAVVRNDEVSWQPTHRVASVPQSATIDDTSTVFRLTFVDGSTRMVPAQVLTVADEDAYSVLATVAEQRPVLGVSVVRNGVELAQSVAAPRPTSSIAKTRVVGERVEVDWPAEWTFAAVTHVADDGERTTLTFDAQGGHASLALGPLKGGRFEVSLSTGADSVLAH